MRIFLKKGAIGRGIKLVMLSSTAALFLLNPQFSMAQQTQQPGARMDPMTRMGPGAALLQSPPVISVAVGVTEFAEGNARSLADTGVNWDLRALWGSAARLGVELAYIGSAYEITAEDGQSTDLFANGVEALGRLNFVRTDPAQIPGGGWQPYLAAGVAWKNYQLADSLAAAAIRRSDDTVEIPISTGVSMYLVNNLVIDARATYRLAFMDDLIQEAGTSTLDNWNVTGRLGWAF